MERLFNETLANAKVRTGIFVSPEFAKLSNVAYTRLTVISKQEVSLMK